MEASLRSPLRVRLQNSRQYVAASVRPTAARQMRSCMQASMAWMRQYSICVH